MTVPERTTIVFSDDKYFGAEASSHEFDMDSRMVTLRMRGKGSCVMTAATLGRVIYQLMLRTASEQGTIRLSRMVSQQKGMLLMQKTLRLPRSLLNHTKTQLLSMRFHCTHKKIKKHPQSFRREELFPSPTAYTGLCFRGKRFC